VGSKNISQRKGFWSEYVVIQLLTAKKWELIGWRSTLDKIEVDLIFKKKNTLLMAEVKFLSSDWNIFERIKPQQIGRLKKAYMKLRFEKADYEILSYVFYVNKHAKVKFISLSDID